MNNLSTDIYMLDFKAKHLSKILMHSIYSAVQVNDDLHKLLSYPYSVLNTEDLLKFLFRMRRF